MNSPFPRNLVWLITIPPSIYETTPASLVMLQHEVHHEPPHPCASASAWPRLASRATKIAFSVTLALCVFGFGLASRRLPHLLTDPRWLVDCIIITVTLSQGAARIVSSTRSMP